jgi:monothiol glutaredoxin
VARFGGYADSRCRSGAKAANSTACATARAMQMAGFNGSGTVGSHARNPLSFEPNPLISGIARSVMDTQQRIKQIVDENGVVLFMKGNAQFPMCGFSGRAVQILKACGVDEFKTVNVLEDDEVRQGIKEFSNWPTIPQLYVKGEFVGGSDIMMEMYQSGELQQLFAAA